MPFNIADIYTSSGSASLFNSWTTPVTKFDPSSFYNWEQDNEPIHDLEERTYMNWEHAGFHTSTVPGMVLTVSADTPAPTLTANPNIFTTVSAAVEALPSDIRFPIVMEIANFGNLGSLNLKNINIGYGGSLEIINRNFVRSYAVSGGVADQSDSCRIHQFMEGATQSQYKLINSISSIDASTVWAETSAVHIGTPVLSESGDSRLTNNINSVFQTFVSGQGNSRLSVCVAGSPSGGAAPNIFALPVFESLGDATDDPHNILEYDVSAKDLLAPSQPEILLNRGVAISNKANGMMYGNYVIGIEVDNCNGPIYIRNFFTNSSDHELDGVSIFNSNDVWLENCVSINNKVGFNIVNSRVYVNRGIAAYRNYGIDVNDKRRAGVWLPASAVTPVTKAATLTDDGAGLRAVNSEIILNTASSIYSRQGSDQGTKGAFEYEVYPMEFLINFSRNSFGVTLDNSILHGGWAGNSSYYLSSLNFNVELSDEYGIYSRNSVIDLDGRLKIYSNSRGMLLENSKAIINECIVMANQYEGIHAINSNIQYNKNLQKLSNVDSNEEYQFDFSGNGRHLVLDQGSTFVPTVTSSMPSKYGQMRFKDHHGVSVCSVGEQTSRILSPIEVKNNSMATLVHPIIKSFSSPISLVGSVASGVPIPGECLSITNNSNVLLQGSKNGASVLYGSEDNPITHAECYAAHRYSAGVYVANNSQLECNGPTVMFNFGVDVLAKNNSIINFNPHKVKGSDGLDTSGWDLKDATNHTSVELHSTNTCLVAKDNSTINMKDLGDYHACWSTGAGTNSADPDYDTGIDGFNTSSYISGGSMQFYPNPVGSEYYLGDPGAATEPAGMIKNGNQSHQSSHTFTTTSMDGVFRNYYLEKTPFLYGDHFTVSSTAGGMCLRALGGSHVNALNINFPVGHWNASGLIYDVSGYETGSGSTLCNRMFIWNIADNSRLHAAFCSVSGMDPRSAPYNGPSATYDYAKGSDANTAGAYHAPSGTPDTSSLSILDFYGICSGAPVNNWPIPQFSSLAVSNTTYMDHQLASGSPGVPLVFSQYGYEADSLQNRGPFRLYVSVDPMVNGFSSINPYNDSVLSNDGVANQLYAQGYNLSSNVSAGPTTLSALYGHSIISLGGLGGTSALSGFVYNNEVVDPTTYNRILLDESAAHTFANAKNGAMGTSNRSKICRIYISRKAYRGEAAGASDEKSFGRGFTSPNVFDLERKE
jgi:hypothetical protein